jgi:hypothetical protein
MIVSMIMQPVSPLGNKEDYIGMVGQPYHRYDARNRPFEGEVEPVGRFIALYEVRALYDTRTTEGGGVKTWDRFFGFTRTLDSSKGSH